MPDYINYTFVHRKVESNLQHILSRAKKASVSILLALGLCITGAPAYAHSQLPTNRLLIQANKILFSSGIIMSAPVKAQKITEMVDMDIFLRNSLPKKTLAKLSADDKASIKVFYRQAMQRTLTQYFSNKYCKPAKSERITKLSKSMELLHDNCYEPGHHLIPMMLIFKYHKGWQLEDIILYTVTLSSAYGVQIENLLLKETWPQVLMAIKQQNAILRKQQIYGGKNG